MDWLAARQAWKASANQCPATSVAGSAAANQRPSRHSVREMLTFKHRWRHNCYKSNAWRHLRALEVWRQDWTLVFGTAGHSVVYQGTASPGLSDASIGKHLFVSFLLFAGPTWAVAARAPPLPFGLGIKVSWFSRRPPKRRHFECLVLLRSPQDLWWQDIYSMLVCILYSAL